MPASTRVLAIRRADAVNVLADAFLDLLRSQAAAGSSARDALEAESQA